LAHRVLGVTTTHGPPFLLFGRSGTCIATRTRQPPQKSKEARTPFDVRALLVLWLEGKSLRSSKPFLPFALNFAALPSGAILFQPNGFFNRVSGNGAII
jgi:hypothetical protein